MGRVSCNDDPRRFARLADVPDVLVLSSAQRMLESIKKTYGPHASLLAINSLSSPLPPSPFLHETYASQPSLDPVRALLDPSAGRRTSLRAEGLDEGDGPQGEEGIETGRRLSETGNNENDELEAGILPDGLSHPLAETAEEGPLAALTSPQRNSKLLGGRLTEDDVVAIKSFLKEFSGGSLIPYMERMVSGFNETVGPARSVALKRLLTTPRANSSTVRARASPAGSLVPVASYGVAATADRAAPASAVSATTPSAACESRLSRG